MELDLQTHIFRIRVTRGMSTISIWSHPFLYSNKKQKCCFVNKKDGATDLKLGMQTQLDSVNNMGWVSSGQTFSSVCEAEKVKSVSLKKILT